MSNYKSREEEILNNIIVSISDDDTWWKLWYEQAHIILKSFQGLWNGAMMVKYHIVIGMLGQVGERGLWLWNIEINIDEITTEKQRNELLWKALLIMMIHYRSAFINLMKQWWKNPEEYIKQYEKHN
jgi:hypothetical protein